MDNYLGQVIGNRYEVQDIIGIGGMSVVYKAYDRVDDRVAAVKILKDEFLANEEFRMRFKNESKAIAVLSHPNIVKVYDVSFGETLQYIVMEYVEGITLKEYIERQGRLSVNEALHFTVQILRALQHAHDKGIVHRDVKPQNIMLLPNATIKVADFGIARFSRAESRNVNETSAIGSVHYISPEQARGEYTDGRADIYSVGVVLYEMLTGRLPFESENDISVALMQLREDAVRPRELNPEIPEGLEQIVLRAMQKNPADRYQSAAEFLLDLDEFRKNPAIKFDYSYFIDKSPTRYLDTGLLGAAAPAREPVRILDEFEPEPETDYDFSQPEPEPEPEEDPEDEAEAIERAERRRTLKIMAGVAAGFVALVLLILVIAFGSQIGDLIGGSGGSFAEKLDVFGWFSKDKTEVPNFINMDIDEALERYGEEFDLKYESVYNPSFDEGRIFEQDPGAGSKVKKNAEIRLKVARSNGKITVKDVIGMNYLAAEAELKALGFQVELVPQKDDTVEKDKVISTSPSPGTYQDKDQLIYVYYSAEESAGVAVPDVTGVQFSVAQQKLENAGLHFGSVTYDASAAALKDYVIGQDPPAGTPAKEGDYVNLRIGTGVPASTEVSFQFNLPDAGTNEGYTLRIYLDGNVYSMEENVKLDGSAFNVDLVGSGSDSVFKIYAETTLICSGRVDFTKEPAVVSDLATYDYAGKAPVPDVVGQLQKDAEDRLTAAGFKNVRVEMQPSDTQYAGIVIAQSPVGSSITQYLTSTVITLTVSAGPGPQEPFPSEDPQTDPVTAAEPDGNW